jgi:H+/Cl- antiporter ClcA
MKWQKWIPICIIVGLLAGSASALFLLSLDQVTEFRQHHIWIVNFLPIAGLLIGLGYYYGGKDVEKGNDVLISEFQQPKQKIPFKIGWMIYISTLLTHLFGGSAGREGTAVQMGGSIADQFSKLFKLDTEERGYLLLIGMSAGFASVFGTPLAGAIFALEILVVKKSIPRVLAISVATAYIAHYTCLAWTVQHTHYSIVVLPELSLMNIIWALLAGVFFGLAAYLFVFLKNKFHGVFQKIKWAPLRPFIGGIFIAFFIVATRSTQFIGLGIPQIVDAFVHPAGHYDFLIKILLTAFTLGAGFKGGEVTPLFFIGATLGNILIWFIPLPMALLAAMGFVAVFAGATNCIITSIVLGIEIFGLSAGLYIGLASVMAYFTSGMTGIYTSPMQQKWKHKVYYSLKNIIKF